MPKRQTFDVLVLRRIAWRDVIRRSRRLPITNCHSRDARRRRCVGFEQCRRNRQRAGDVVEASRGIVGRQVRGRIDFKIEQIANRVCVLGSIQTMQHDRPRIRLAEGLPIDLGFEPVA